MPKPRPRQSRSNGLPLIAGLAAFAWATLAWTGSALAAASLPTGTRTITLIAKDGARLPIGTVAFTPAGEAAHIAVNLDAPQFSNEFLSMRPFRCLSGQDLMWCHLEYPYETRRTVTTTDLTDLEYELMFLWRTYDRVGVDAWNGLYFKLDLGADGTITGTLHEADYNAVASPPMEAFARPIGPGDLTLSHSDRQLYHGIEIR